MTDRCRDTSIACDEPLGGTASRVRRWLLVEVPGPWPARDWSDCVPSGEAMLLRRFARRHRARVVLIRRGPGADAGAVDPTPAGAPRRQLFWADSDALPDGVLRTATGTLEEVLADDAPAPSEWKAVGAPLWLVCVHSTHDVCCGIYGRALVREIGDRHRDQVWECSHIGGDRFAANVVELPTGVYYGRVTAGEWPAIPAAHGRGAIHLPLYRGRAAYGWLSQWAEIAVRERFDLDGRDDVRVVRAGAQPDDPDADRVIEVVAAGRLMTVALALAPVLPRRLTCRSTDEESPPRYVVSSISAADDVG